MEKVKPKLSPEDAKAIAQAINGALGVALGRLTGTLDPESTLAKGTVARAADAGAASSAMTHANGKLDLGVADFEELYQRIKRRLVDECRVDPILLHLLTQAPPELRIDIEPTTIELEGGSLRGRICRLVGAGWFDNVRSQGETIRELKRTGTEPAGNRMSEAMISLVNDRVLTREQDGYQKAPGVTVTERVLTAV